MFLLSFSSFSPRMRAAEPLPLGKLTRSELQARAAHDLDAVLQYRKGLQQTRAFILANPEAFPPKPLANDRLLDAGQRELVRETWKNLLDYYFALDSIGQYYSSYWRVRNRHDRGTAFAVAYTAFLTQYRFALDVIARVENDPALGKLFNEAVADAGLPDGTYTRFKFRFLNVGRATEFAALQAACSVLLNDDLSTEVRTALDEDAAVIWEAGRGQGERLTAKNGLRIIRNAGFTAWFPVQKGVAEWMGDIKVRRRDMYLITDEQLRAIVPELRPGDILLTRREWHLSNIGLPGFWTHAALYVGTPAERTAFFDDPDVRKWVVAKGQADGDLNALLAHRFPAAWERATAPDAQGVLPRIIESVGEGVIFSTLEHAAHADSIAILRPRVAKSAKAIALFRAFGYSGRPYDFNFDFQTDAALVCSELIFKAYEPVEGSPGLALPLKNVAGRIVLPPNELARLHAEAVEKAEGQIFDFVLFLDGQEQAKHAIRADEALFNLTWTRPKWHVFMQDNAKTGL